jgi:hypothetical protein
MQDECEEMLEDIIWNEEADCWGYWKDGVFYEQPHYSLLLEAYFDEGWGDDE